MCLTGSAAFKSTEIYETNKNVEIYQYIFQVWASQESVW